MLAAATTLALFGFILAMVVGVMRRDGTKIVSRPRGKRSWTAQPTAEQAQMMRFSPRCKAAEPGGAAG